MTDENADVIAEFLARFEAATREVATVTREALEFGVDTRVEPRNPDALPMTWLVMKDEVIFQAGSHGGRWELAKTAEDVGWMERVASAVAHGRVRQTFGPSRSQVEVTMEDGTTETQTGYSTGYGLLPMPGWRRRGRVLAYASYFDQQDEAKRPH